MTRTRHIAVIPAANRTAANNALAARGWGPNTFSRPLTSSVSAATAAPTHYACDAALTAGELADLQSILGAQADKIYDRGDLSSPNRLNGVLSSLNLQRQQTEEAGHG